MNMPRPPAAPSVAGQSPSRRPRVAALKRHMLALSLALVGYAVLPQPATAASAQSSAAAAAHPSRGVWLESKALLSASAARGKRVAVAPRKYRALTLDRGTFASLAAISPREGTDLARNAPNIMSLPDPSGGYQRFALVDSPVMEPGLAAKHPEIRTYAGKGIDDPKATIRVSVSPLGVQASVRSPNGSWYIDPYYHLDDSVYVSYYRGDLADTRGPLRETTLNEPVLSVSHGRLHAADTVQVRGAGFAPGAQVKIAVQNIAADKVPRQVVYAQADREGIVSASLPADPYNGTGSYAITATADGGGTAESLYEVVPDGAATNAVTGTQLRTYRLALVTDPTYANYFGGSANVTAAKVALVNRVTQVYESETSIRLVLVADNDKLNLDTDALATGANGPCGANACYSAATLASCGDDQGLARNRIVIGLLVGADKYDIGHLALGVNGGGVANLGVVGAASKAQGCTGVPSPTGDYYAVDYVAHEMGHQFSGNHTFNGTISSCSASNRNAGTSVEPGSGSSIMAYAGICGTDNLQSHSDAYWSQRSFDEITTYTSSSESTLNEVQQAALTRFSSNGQQFVISYNGNASVPIVRGTNFTTAGIKAAIQGISGWPSGGTVTVSAVSDAAFTVTFGGNLASTDVPTLQLSGCTAPCTGYINTLTNGGSTKRRGTISGTGNNPPVVTTPASFTIPIRTPFALTGSATDPDGDTLTYMWEQNDRGASGTSGGTGLISQPKLNGPLFRQFGKRTVVSNSDSLQYNSPGENLTDGNPTRVFPDMDQILANNTNAETGSCPAASSPATAAQIDCFSEFLPTAAYVGTTSVNASPLSLNFRLTVRDGRGGVASGNTQLLLATAAGPFLVTAPNTFTILDGMSPTTVGWSVAGTNVAPVSTSNVKITLSTDGGKSFPYVLASSVPNNGSATVTLPNVGTNKARIKVEAVGNVFFDVSNADFVIKPTGDVNSDGVVDCADLAIVRASFGRRTGQPGFDARADVTKDGLVDARDLQFVTVRLAPGTSCN